MRFWNLAQLFKGKDSNRTFHSIVCNIYKDPLKTTVGTWMLLPLFLFAVPLYFAIYYLILYGGKYALQRGETK
jgi:hypothetical protein